jgi:phosphoribosylanthranilate isomerase
VKATRRPRVKVCCIASVEEAWLAIEHGAAALGLVSARPSGPGVISEEAIAAIAAVVPPPVASVLLTSRHAASDIVAQQRRTGVRAVQLVDRLESGAHAALREALPGIALIQVVHVTGPESVDEAVAVASSVDAILLDSGNTALAVKELGGTGRRHDWRLSRRIREAVPVPIFLAGGLGAENVGAAIDEVGPFGLDLCTGVRTDGQLDAGKLARFMTAVAAAA